MAKQRIFHSFFILAFLSTFSLSPLEMNTQDLQFLQTWEIEHIDRMNPADLHLLGNALNLLYTCAIIEGKTRQFSHPIAQLNQKIRTNIEQYKNTTEELTTLKTLLDRLSFVVSTRTIYNQTLATCFAHYNKNTSSAIEAALTDLQLFAQKKLRHWAEQQLSETSKLLAEKADIINNTAQLFQEACHLYKEMSKGSIPLKLSSQDEQNKQLILLSIILESNSKLFAISEYTTDSLLTITDHAAEVINAGTEIYKQFYMIVYNKLMSSSIDKKYATTLFSMYDVLSDEYKSILPDADHVFEHALKTTKLYTQTEFSPL